MSSRQPAPGFSGAAAGAACVAIVGTILATASACAARVTTVEQNVSDVADVRDLLDRGDTATDRACAAATAAPAAVKATSSSAAPATPAPSAAPIRHVRNPHDRWIRPRDTARPVVVHRAPAWATSFVGLLAITGLLLFIAWRSPSPPTSASKRSPAPPTSHTGSLSREVVCLACSRCHRAVDVPRDRLTRQLFCPRCGTTLPREV
jgi:hypothetical protein